MTNRYLLIALMGLLVSCGAKEHAPSMQDQMAMSENKGLKLNALQMQLANIKTDTVRMDSIGTEKLFVGKTVINENTTQVVSSKVAGRIEKMYLKSTGDFVRKGDLLYEIYSEELISVQKEYLLAQEKKQKLGNYRNDYVDLLETAKNKLLLYGMTPGQIALLNENTVVSDRVKVYSPVSGYIHKLKTEEGDYVMSGSPVVELADYSTLWIEAQVYPDDIQYVRGNSPVMYSINALPEIYGKGTISFISPEMEKNSTIMLIRVEIRNPQGKIKPGLMAEIKMTYDMKKAVVVPSNAVITDSRGSSVWILDSTGYFNIRMVATGIKNSRSVEIISGLKPGEQVVTSGVYLLNSEYILKKGLDPMSGMNM